MKDKEDVGVLDNSQDKGYITVRIKKSEDVFYLSEVSFDTLQDETNFYVDYEGGKIYIEFKEGAEVIGYYDTTPDSNGMAKVYDRSRERVIGRVGGELIYFRKNEADLSVGRYSPEEACLAYYNKSGSITATNNLLTYRGLINGSEIGGAAAFVALLYSYNFKSIYRDFYEIEFAAFQEKHASYLNPI